MASRNSIRFTKLKNLGTIVKLISSFPLSTSMIYFWLYFAGNISDDVRSAIIPIRTVAKSQADQLYGVGFDLTISYGTIALSFINGSVISVAKVEANPEYDEMMARFSLKLSQHPSPPYQCFGEAVYDLPASKDVGTLSKLISELRNKVEDYLHDDVFSALAAAPHLAALYNEDIVDAFEYAGFKFNDVFFYHHLTQENGVGYAGNGLGLCSDYTDPPSCKADQQQMPEETLLSVLYTRKALIAALSIMKSSYYLWEPDYRVVENLGLGYDSRQHDQNEDYYWEDVFNTIQQTMVMNPHYPKPSKVILLGESAHEEKFIQVLEVAFRGLMDDMPKNFRDDPLYVGARGAAEFSTRAPYNPYTLEECQTDGLWRIMTYSLKAECEIKGSSDS